MTGYSTWSAFGASAGTGSSAGQTPSDMASAAWQWVGHSSSQPSGSRTKLEDLANAASATPAAAKRRSDGAGARRGFGMPSFVLSGMTSPAVSLPTFPTSPSPAPTWSSSLSSLVPSSASSSSAGTASPAGYWNSLLEWGRSMDPNRLSKAQKEALLWENRTILSAGSASLVSTAASFPFDSLKSRLQVKYYPSIWACGRAVMKEEGLGGFFRGVTIPLITISFVRTSSFSIYVNTKQALHDRGMLSDRKSLRDTALSGMSGGATSGVIISCGSAPFELVKVQRQLEYLTAVQKGLVSSTQGGMYRPRSGFEAAADIWRNHGGPRGFYLGFPLHICRDTLGTAFYFGFYDTIRALVNRHSTKNTPSGPSLFGLPAPVVSFLSGSTAGIASWLLVYPIDLLKTNVQQRALSGHPNQVTGYQLFLQMLSQRSGAGESATDPFVKRFLRLYRGLGVSALRSFISHGLTWAIIEQVQAKLAVYKPADA